MPKSSMDNVTPRAFSLASAIITCSVLSTRLDSVSSSSSAEAGRPVCAKAAATVCSSAPLVQQYRSDVHCNTRDVQPLSLPAFGLSTRLDHYPFANIHDQTALLGCGNELPGRDQSPLRMLPAQQGFRAYYSADGEIQLQLIVQKKLLSLQSKPQAVDEVQPPPHLASSAAL